MPATPKFIPENIQGVRVVYQKLYPFNPIPGNNVQALDTIKLTPQKSGLFYMIAYFYDNPPNLGVSPVFYAQTQYYPPGSTNYSTSTYWNYNFFGEGSGYAFIARYLQPELTCQTIVSNASTYNTNYAAPPPSGGPPWYNYICYYKYNTNYMLYATDGAGYVSPGTTAWVVIAGNGLPNVPGYFVLRVVAIWEVY